MTDINDYTTRTYGRRQGRLLTDRQRKLLEELLPLVSIDIPESDLPVIPNIYFDTKQPVWMEVGFGGGEHIANLAKNHPGINIIGCEPFLNGVVSLLSHLDEKKLKNVRIFNGNALDVFQSLQDNVLERFYLMFADPWPKKRHHKRRFVQSEILDLVIPKLVAGAEMRFATDHEDYQEWMLKHLRQRSDLKEELYTFDKPLDWPNTRYEAKAIREGRKPLYLVFSVIK